MSSVRDDLKEIYLRGIEAVNPETAVKNHLVLSGDRLTLMRSGVELKTFNLDDFKNIYVVGGGKATAPMAKAVEELLGKRISDGCISVKYGYTVDLKTISICEASHPIPDENGVKGASCILSILEKAGKDDLVISLISGGGSALLPLPPEPITLDEKRKTTDLLLKSGASIHEINSIRKHLSLVKGGNMARAASPATVINLMISDVVGDNKDVIASGPFVPDDSTFHSAMDILERYGLSDKVPRNVLDRIRSGVDGATGENPRADDPLFEKVTNLIVASNIIALTAAKAEAEKRGYNTIILSSLIEGDTADVADWHSRIAREILMSSNPTPAPACVISGGETTVRVTGTGLGGRNMEFALQSARHITGTAGVTMASVGTDGTDGPTDAAGAVADWQTVERAGEKGVDIETYRKNNDSYNFFKELGDLVVTGPTNTNVMDMRFIIIKL